MRLLGQGRNLPALFFPGGSPESWSSGLSPPLTGQLLKLLPGEKISGCQGYELSRLGKEPLKALSRSLALVQTMIQESVGLRSL